MGGHDPVHVGGISRGQVARPGTATAISPTASAVSRPLVTPGMRGCAWAYLSAIRSTTALGRVCQYKVGPETPRTHVGGVRLGVDQHAVSVETHRLDHPTIVRDGVKRRSADGDAQWGS